MPFHHRGPMLGSLLGRLVGGDRMGGRRRPRRDPRRGDRHGRRDSVLDRRNDAPAKAGLGAVTGKSLEIDALASRLIAAQDGATTLAPITAGAPEFDVSMAYEVLRVVVSRRIAGG